MRYKKLSGVRLSNSGKLLIPTRKLYKQFADSGKTTYAGIYKKKLLLSGKKFFDRYAVLLERAKSKGLISFCEVSP